MFQAEIGAPKLSLAGFGTGIHVNISLPEPDRNSGVNDIGSHYMASYDISVKSRNEEKVRHPRFTPVTHHRFHNCTFDDDNRHFDSSQQDHQV